jgi:hypothetical protein
MRARADDDDRVDLWREEVGVLSECLANKALRPVALDGAPDFSRCDHAKTRRAAMTAVAAVAAIAIVDASREEDQEMPRGDACAAFLNADEVRALTDALGSREFRAGEGDDSATSCRWW